MTHVVVALSILASSSVTLLGTGDTPPGLGHSLLAQAEAPARRTYTQFLLIRQGGERIEGNNGVLEANRLTGMSLTGESIDVPRSEIHILYTTRGSRVGSMAMYGGLGGLALTGAFVVTLHFIPSFSSHDSAALISVAALGGGTLLGAGLGALIGLTEHRGWHVEPLVSPGKLYVLQLSFNA